MQVEKFKAENDWVVVKGEDHSRIKSNGIIVVVEAEQALKKGTVIAMGDKVKLPEEVKVSGTIYYFDDAVKSRFILDNVEYLNIKYTDLLGYDGE